MDSFSRWKALQDLSCPTVEASVNSENTCQYLEGVFRFGYDPGRMNDGCACSRQFSNRLGLASRIPEGCRAELLLYLYNGIYTFSRHVRRSILLEKKRREVTIEDNDV